MTMRREDKRGQKSNRKISVPPFFCQTQSVVHFECAAFAKRFAPLWTNENRRRGRMKRYGPLDAIPRSTGASAVELQRQLPPSTF